jgi:hypothetical protein
MLTGMGKIKKVGDLESQNLSIENRSRNTGIEKSHIVISIWSKFVQDEKVRD